MLNSKTGTKLDTFVSDYVVFDLETTGISPYSDKVVEIYRFCVNCWPERM